MNNRFFATLGVIFAILLLLIAAGAGSIWAYQTYLAHFAPTTQEAGRQPPPPAPPAEPAVPEKPIQPAITPPPAAAPADDTLRAAVWDRERVMSESAAGKALSKYADDYAAVMDANIKTLSDAIAAKTPGLNVAEARRLISQYKERKTGIQRDVRDFLLQLVTGAAAEQPLIRRAVLLEKGAVTWAAAEADATNALIEALDAVNVELPPLPQQLELRPPKPANRPAAAPAAKPVADKKSSRKK